MGQLGDLTPEGSIILGVFVGLGSTSIQSLGLTLQRKSHILEDRKSVQEAPRPPYRRRRWQLGIFMFLISNIVGSTIQITTLPLPVLSALQASGLVFNSICATLILGEEFTKYSLAGTILVCGGAILIAIFGAIGEPAHNLDQLLALLGRREFLLWMVGQTVLVLAIIIGTRSLKLLNPHNNNSPRMRLTRGMAYGCISGILSAHSLLVAKSAVELLVRTVVDHKNQFDQWQSWVILIGLILLAFSQLFYLNRGLKLCSTSILYPFVFCVYNIIAILDGLIYFNQMSRLSVLHAILVTLGTVILLIGVICLSWRLNDDHGASQVAKQANIAQVVAFVSPDQESEIENVASGQDDEEASLLPRRSVTFPAKLERSPSSGHGYGTLRGKRTVRYASDNETRVLAAESTDSLYSPDKRHTIRAEADEIWGELQEDLPSGTNSPFTGRQSIGARLTPSRERPASIDETFGDNNEATSPTESSTAPMLTYGSGRSYRDRKRRRSTSVLEDQRRRTGSRERTQGALGGLIKMRQWWNSSSGKRRSRGKAVDARAVEDTGPT